MKRLVQFPSESGKPIVVEVEDMGLAGETRRGLPTSAVAERAQTSFEESWPGLRPAGYLPCPYSAECVEGVSLLKNSLYAHSDPGSGPKYTGCGGFRSFWSPIRSHFRLGADFFNRLGSSPK